MREFAEREAQPIVDAIRTGANGAINRFIDNDLKQLSAHYRRQQYRVARRVQLVGRALNVFNFENKQYLSQATRKAMQEAERVFSAAFDLSQSTNEVERTQAVAEFDRAEHLIKVVAAMVEREAPKFMADPQAWIKTWQRGEDMAKAKRAAAEAREQARRREWIQTAPEVEIVDLLVRWMKDGGRDLDAKGRPRDVVLAALEARAEQLRSSNTSPEQEAHQ